MPAWFDLMSLDPNGAEDAAGIKKSKEVVEKIIAEEINNGIPASRILIGGFSQVRFKKTLIREFYILTSTTFYLSS